MKICSSCFIDSEIKGIIESISIKGACDICGEKNAFIYNTDTNDELISYFEEFVNIYTPKNLLPDTFPNSQLVLLKDEIKNNWQLFNDVSANQIYDFVVSLCSDMYSYLPSLFDEPVGLQELYDENFLEQHAILLNNDWEDFVESLKQRNRFHTKNINLNMLELFCSYIRKPYTKGSKFYRGRISDSCAGVPIDEMSAPPYKLASSGRANAEGIRCLYLANDIDTTIYEVRAGAYDYVSIGEFELKEDIIVIDFKLIDKISPFIDGLDFKEHAVNRMVLNKINEEMGKVLLRSDSPLDYIPTQYISDFIKSLEYSGVEYTSTMNKTGHNIAIFDPGLFECTDVKTYHIKDLSYIKELL